MKKIPLLITLLLLSGITFAQTTRSFPIYSASTTFQSSILFQNSAATGVGMSRMTDQKARICK